jgi:hypothetical protein
MAKQTTVTLLDDLDGSKAEATVSFGWQGKSYEIDLSRKNSRALEKALAPYIAAARPIRGSSSGSRRPGRGSASAAGRPQLALVRSWARDNGYPDLADRGRIPVEVQSAYDAAH